jgi:hypothetical protein
MVARRYNPVLEAFFERLFPAGKPKIVPSSRSTASC